MAKKESSPKKCGRASHPTASFRGSLPYAFTPRSGETTVPVRQRPARSATFTSTGCEIAIQRTAFPQPLQRPAAQPATRAGSGGGRNARATSTRSRAFPIPPGNSPSRIASCHQRHRNHRSASVESSNVFAAPTLRENVTTSNRKTLRLCEQAVEDHTCLWNVEEKAGEIWAKECLRVAHELARC
jgi:hypothetical protein